MLTDPMPRPRAETSQRFRAEVLEIDTTKRLQFIDVTDQVREVIRRSGVTQGLVNIQTRHTTTGIVVNEHEPLLIEDLKDLLRRWAPQDASYRHDDLTVRTVNLAPEERSNGDSHAQALVLGTSESLNIVDGVLQLGRWQRIFLIELDGAQRRKLSIVAMGLGDDPVDHGELLLPLLRASGVAS